jgi:hypothetical protein
MTGLNVTRSASITGLKVPGMGITGSNALEFGADVGGKQGAAGKIGYQVWGDKDALDIVGAGTDIPNRKIKFWAEGGATFNGSLNVSGNVQLHSSPGVSAAAGMHGNDRYRLEKTANLITASSAGVTHNALILRPAF